MIVYQVPDAQLCTLILWRPHVRALIKLYILYLTIYTQYIHGTLRHGWSFRELLARKCERASCARRMMIVKLRNWTQFIYFVGGWCARVASRMAHSFFAFIFCNVTYSGRPSLARHCAMKIIHVSCSSLEFRCVLFEYITYTCAYYGKSLYISP